MLPFGEKVYLYRISSICRGWYNEVSDIHWWSWDMSSENGEGGVATILTLTYFIWTLSSVTSKMVYQEETKTMRGLFVHSMPSQKELKAMCII